MKKSYLILFSILLASCAKEENSSFINRIDNDTQYMSFSSTEELKRFVQNVKDTPVLPMTKSDVSGFKSLWQTEYDELMNSLDSQTLNLMSAENLVYEPEDELILDPSFAKILNSKREVMVAGRVYRYVREGVLIYDGSIDESVLSAIDLSPYQNLSHGDVVSCGNDVSFMKITYSHLKQKSNYIEMPMTRSPWGHNGITLGNGTHISESDVHRLIYDQENSDANGFAQFVSGIFGENVVAINEFDSRHRITMRAFSQDYGIYSSIGMAVRMQQKVMGIWFRYLADEIRYGWTGVECSYRYTSMIDPEIMNNVITVIQNINCYDDDVVFFRLNEGSVSSSPISSAVPTALYNNRTRVNNWISENPSYANNPRGVMYIKNEGMNANLHYLYPQFEDVEYDDRREHVVWDLNGFPSVTISSETASFGSVSGQINLDRLLNLEIVRGEFYGAAKYNGQWKACVISTE